MKTELTKVEKVIGKAHKVAFFFVIEQKTGTSNGVPVTRIIADTEFTKAECQMIKGLGAYQAGNMYYKSAPDHRYGWFDVAMN